MAGMRAVSAAMMRLFSRSRSLACSSCSRRAAIVSSFAEMSAELSDCSRSVA